jgi:hypothetical protein
MTQILDIPVSTGLEWKFGLITYYVYRAHEDRFEIDDTSGDWVRAEVNKETMTKILSGEVRLDSLNWF